MACWHSFFGLLAGLVFLMAGWLCMVYGQHGNTIMHASVWGFRVRVKTSVPGIIFALLGVFVIFITRAG